MSYKPGHGLECRQGKADKSKLFRVFEQIFNGDLSEALCMNTQICPSQTSPGEVTGPMPAHHALNDPTLPRDVPGGSPDIFGAGRHDTN